jgi:hypothetical protein
MQSLYENSGVHWDSNSQSGNPLRMCGFIPSHLPTLLGARNVTPELHFWLALLQALSLVTSPRLGSRHTTSFVTGLISCTTTNLGQNSMHNYLLVFKFVVRILMATLLEMPLFIAWTHHICLPFFASLFLLSWWFPNFQYSLVSSYFLHKWLQLFYVQTRCPSSSPLWLSKNMAAMLLKKSG